MTDGNHTEVDYGYYSQQQRQFKNKVRSNWQCNDGACKGCPVRHAEHSPDHSAFSTNSDLMIVAEAPGVSRGGARAIEDRTYQPEAWNDVSPNAELEEYDRNIVEDWSVPGKTQTIDYIEELVRKNRVPLDVTEIFYTNAIKCGKIDDWETDSDARNHCLSYLEEEITDLVEPKLIIPMGDHAIRAVDDVVNFSQHTNTRKMKTLHNEFGPENTFPVLKTKIDSVRVIPAKHWSYLGSYISQHVGWADDNTEYWNKLADQINKSLGL
jgi:uracil-DNA glycosylase